MANHSFPGHADPVAGPYNLFKLGDSFADWANRIALPQASAPDLGLYGRGVTVTDGVWYVFRGDTQPTSWGDAVGVWSSPDAATTGSGENAVPIRVHSDNVNIRGAVVSVFQSGSLVAWGTTNTSGIATMNLASGSYTINVSASGFASQSNVAISVPPGSAIAVDMDPQSLPAPPPLDGLCTVRVHVVTSANAVVQNAVVQAELDEGSMTDGSLIANSIVQGTTNASGIVDLVLVQKSEFRYGGFYDISVTLPDGTIALHRKGKVPDVTTCTIDDLLFQGAR